MNDRQFFNELQAVNCRYNFKIDKDKKCRSKKCMMNQDKLIKKNIQLKGCNIYNRKAVQKLLKDK